MIAGIWNVRRLIIGKAKTMSFVYFVQDYVLPLLLGILFIAAFTAGVWVVG